MWRRSVIYRLIRDHHTRRSPLRRREERKTNFEQLTQYNAVQWCATECFSYRIDSDVQQLVLTLLAALAVSDVRGHHNPKGVARRLELYQQAGKQATIDRQYSFVVPNCNNNNNNNRAVATIV